MQKMFNFPEILLIDDDENFCSAAKAFFTQQDLDVATISDPTALAAINLTKFKIILLDLDMPRITGQEIVEGMPLNNRPVIIIVSGHSDIETRMAVLDSGADFFMAKPINLGELSLIVKRALGRRPQVSQTSEDWVLNRQRMSIETPEGQTYGLSSSEFRVLEQLFRNAPEGTNRSDLVRVSVGQGGNETAQKIRSLEVMLSRMRRRFSTDDTPLPIKSVRNVGYIFHGTCKIID